MSEPTDYTPPLDDEGRLMTGTDHHYTDESIRARIEQLRRFASGSNESAEEWANLDWRGFCNTTRHILSSLYAALDGDDEGKRVAQLTDTLQSILDITNEAHHTREAGNKLTEIRSYARLALSTEAA